MNNQFPPSGRLLVGCNYWGSKAGVHMWRERDWDEAAVEKDISGKLTTARRRSSIGRQ